MVATKNVSNNNFLKNDTNNITNNRTRCGYSAFAYDDNDFQR